MPRDHFALSPSQLRKIRVVFPPSFSQGSQHAELYRLNSSVIARRGHRLASHMSHWAGSLTFRVVRKARMIDTMSGLDRMMVDRLFMMLCLGAFLVRDALRSSREASSLIAFNLRHLFCLPRTFARSSCQACTSRMRRVDMTSSRSSEWSPRIWSRNCTTSSDSCFVRASIASTVASILIGLLKKENP